jgi:endonuclease-3
VFSSAAYESSVNSSSTGSHSRSSADRPATIVPHHKPPTRRTLRRVNALLIECYGQRTPAPRDPLDGLILIILSQATNDINCDRVFRSLKAAFPIWEDVLSASVEAVADAIRSGGLANQKAARIQQMLRQIKEESGALDLSWMHGATPQACTEYLEKFHGIGPKTIACVLVFFLNKPAFPVDTHVLRVTKRLGWLRPQASAEEAHRVLGALVPDDCKLDLHVNLISHGRAVCRAQGNGGPRCGECLLRRHCHYGKTVGVKPSARNGKPADKFHGSDFFVTLS